MFKTCIAAALLLFAATTASAQTENVRDYGEIPGVEGRAQVTITIEKGHYEVLVATARASGGKPKGEGVLQRAGLGVDIYVGDEICSADRDVRRQLNVSEFKGKFATSATCMKVLGPGEHVLLAERTSINVEGAKMVLTYSLLGGGPRDAAQSAN